MKTDSKFWKKVDKSSENGCWIWKGHINKKWGYGHLSRRDKATGKDKTWLSHRWAWHLENGPISDGVCVLHKCDVPACVRPDHLFLGTHKDNANDRDRKGRHGKAFGEKNPQARLTASQVRKIRDLWRNRSLSQQEIAFEFEITQGAVWRIVHRKTWAHIS